MGGKRRAKSWVKFLEDPWQHVLFRQHQLSGWVCDGGACLPFGSSGLVWVLWGASVQRRMQGKHKQDHPEPKKIQGVLRATSAQGTSKVNQRRGQGNRSHRTATSTRRVGIGLKGAWATKGQQNLWIHRAGVLYSWGGPQGQKQKRFGTPVPRILKLCPGPLRPRF